MDFLNFADIEEQYANDKQLRREDIGKLEEWQLIQPHLPSPLHPIETALFLHSCLYSIEATKHCIDAYFTFRANCPEFFANRDPFNSELQLGMKTIVSVMLPHLTSERFMVLYGHIRDPNPDAFNWNTMFKLGDMVISLATKRHGCAQGLIVIVNLKGFSMSHLLKCNIKTVQNLMVYLQIALPVRLISIHFVNSVPFVDTMLVMVKPFLAAKFKDLLKVHFGDNETIFKFVPKNVLPIECGGDSFCVEEYFRNVGCKDIERYAEYFKVEERQIADKSKRPTEFKTNFEFGGIQGTFKKLDLD